MQIEQLIAGSLVILAALGVWVVIRALASLIDH
jgi:uncharacterized membrane protein